MVSRSCAPDEFGVRLWLRFPVRANAPAPDLHGRKLPSGIEHNEIRLSSGRADSQALLYAHRPRGIGCRGDVDTVAGDLYISIASEGGIDGPRLAMVQTPHCVEKECSGAGGKSGVYPAPQLTWWILILH
jgi:hypothetical protein